jgi:ketosteroid isomerase-like protein
MDRNATPQPFDERRTRCRFVDASVDGEGVRRLGGRATKPGRALLSAASGGVS